MSSSEFEEKKWLAEQTVKMMHELGEEWKHEMDNWKATQKAINDSLNSTRSQLIGAIGFAVTAFLALASLRILDSSFDIFIIFSTAAGAGSAIWIGMDRFANWVDSKLDGPGQAYIQGFVNIGYVATTFYPKTFHLRNLTLEYLDLFKDYAPVAIVAQYGNVLNAVDDIRKSVSWRVTKYDTSPALKRIQDYVEGGYQQYVRRRNEFRDENILSAELRSFLDFYEDRYRAERNAKGQ